LQSTGDAAQRELRSPGGANIWLCQLGSADTDGPFADFQDKVLATPVQWESAGVTWTTARGETLTWRWTGPLLVNAAPVELVTAAHVENAYTQTPPGAPHMDIVHGEQGLRLIFDEGSAAA
jgi:hypothetical protein